MEVATVGTYQGLQERRSRGTGFRTGPVFLPLVPGRVADDAARLSRRRCAGGPHSQTGWAVGAMGARAFARALAAALKTRSCWFSLFSAVPGNAIVCGVVQCYSPRPRASRD